MFIVYIQIEIQATSWPTRQKLPSAALTRPNAVKDDNKIIISPPPPFRCGTWPSPTSISTRRSTSQSPAPSPRRPSPWTPRRRHGNVSAMNETTPVVFLRTLNAVVFLVASSHVIIICYSTALNILKALNPFNSSVSAVKGISVYVMLRLPRSLL